MSQSLGAQFEPAVLAQAAEHSRQAKARGNAEPWDEAYSADHAAHGANPIFHSTGWHNEGDHCGYSTCKNYSEEYSTKMMDERGGIGSSGSGVIKRINPRTAPLVANEPGIDLNAVHRYAQQDPGKGPPIVVGYEKKLHIVDGHHRLLAAHLTGREIDVEHIK